MAATSELAALPVQPPKLPDLAPVSAPQPLGLYVSIPFCRAKCTFCNFASGVYPASAMPAYVQALQQQVRSARGWAQAHNLVLPERVDTIYLGGGTPSLLPPELIHSLFRCIRSQFDVDADAEITLEAAPLQLEPATLEAAMSEGVNRVSFGVQSFVEGEARATARTHSGTQALAELERVRAAGIRHVSADLIAGLPGQTGASWFHSLAALKAAPLDHASIYMFELDEDSRLGAEALRGGIRFGADLLPSDDAVADWYSQACVTLNEAGLDQYEISNFARLGGRSRHNERYWLRQPYLGFGVDAHSMLHTTSGLAEGRSARFAAGDQLGAFLAGSSWEQPEAVTPQAALEECWFLGLRRTAGVSLGRLAADFGSEALGPCLSVVAELTEAGLLEAATSAEGAPIVRLTSRGRLLSNSVFGALVGLKPVSPDPIPMALTPQMTALYG